MKVLCADCKKDTNHLLLHEISNIYGDDHVWGKTTYQTVQCRGCDDITLRTIGIFSEDLDPTDGTPIEDIKLYPLRGKNNLNIKSFYSAPKIVRQIYSEMIEAFNNKLNLLCAGGLRATIEAICKAVGVSDGPIEVGKDGFKRVIRKRNLQGKICGLYEKGLLTKYHADILNEHRFLGNEALHSLDKPSIEELKFAIEIIEHTIENLFELTEKVEDLRYSKKRRSKKK